MLREERPDKKIRDDVNDAKLEEVVVDLKGTYRLFILRTKNTVDCMNVQGNTVTGTVLMAKEFRDFGAHVMMQPSLTFKKN